MPLVIKFLGMWWRVSTNSCLAGEDFKTITGGLAKEHVEKKWIKCWWGNEAILSSLRIGEESVKQDLFCWGFFCFFFCLQDSLFYFLCVIASLASLHFGDRSSGYISWSQIRNSSLGWAVYDNVKFSVPQHNDQFIVGFDGF